MTSQPTPAGPATTQLGSPPVTYGELNTKDPIFFIQIQDIQQLHAIIQSAPVDAQAQLPDPPTQQQLLAEVFRPRQLESSTHADNNPSANLRKILSTAPTDLVTLAQTNRID